MAPPWSGLVMWVGVILIIIGACDLWVIIAGGKTDSNWKRSVGKMVFGLAVVGVGLLMSLFGI